MMNYLYLFNTLFIIFFGRKDENLKISDYNKCVKEKSNSYNDINYFKKNSLKISNYFLERIKNIKCFSKLCCFKILPHKKRFKKYLKVIVLNNSYQSNSTNDILETKKKSEKKIQENNLNKLSKIKLRIIYSSDIFGKKFLIY